MTFFRKSGLVKAIAFVATALLMIVIASGVAYVVNHSERSRDKIALDSSLDSDSTIPKNYETNEMWAGTFRMDEAGKILIRRGVVGENDLGTNSKMAYYEEPEWTFELADDVDIFLYHPVNEAEGAAITREAFLEILKEYQIDCYFHLTDDENIDYIRGVFYS